MTVGAAFNRLGFLAHHEVIDRQIIRVLLRGAGHRTLQIDAMLGGLDHVGVAAVLAVRVQNLRLAIVGFQLLDHRHTGILVRGVSRLPVDAGDQLNLILRTAGLGDLSLIAGALVSVT